MLEAMRHRGPDGQRTRVAGEMAFGFCRLAILDLYAGDQPMTSEDGAIWAMVNGEIYNHEELRSELGRFGHQLSTRCDAEVVPHLYEQYGLDFLSRLRGMFALALYDSRRHELLLARDPFGIKPLYYTETPRLFLFASEIRGLLASRQIEPELDLQAVWDYFTFQYVPETESIFRGVRKVLPAHVLRVRRDHLEQYRYWSPAFPELPERFPWPEAVAAVRATLRDAVLRHLQSDVPIGAYLSGGIDSAAVVALMRAAGHRPLTFSLGFAGQPRAHDEIPYARRTAAVLGTSHHEIRLGWPDYRDHLPEIVYHQEEPLADPSAPALFFLARAAKAHVRVILSGEGADELFAGYPIYGEAQSLALFRKLPGGARQRLAHLARRLPAGLPGRGFLERGTSPLARRYYGNARLFLEDAKRLLFNGTSGDFLPSWRLTEPVYTEHPGQEDLRLMQLVDCHTWLPGDILMKADKMAMAHSIELRVPFLDREVAALAFRLPADYCLSGGVHKRILRQALAPLLPRDIRQRRKLGFPVPFRRWLRAEGAGYLEELLQSTTVDFLDGQLLLRLLREHRSGRADHGRELWAVLVLLLWLRTFRPMLPLGSPAPLPLGAT